MTTLVSHSKSMVPFMVTFTNGSITVVDAHSTYEAIQAGKTKSHLTPVRAVHITTDEAIRLEKQLYSK